MFIDRGNLSKIINAELASVGIIDMHTHLFPGQYGDMLLWGIDEILTYHYLVAEFFRYSTIPYAKFFGFPKEKQADLIWQTLFLERSPISEAQRGVLTILQMLDLEVHSRTLSDYRAYYKGLCLAEHIDHVFTLSNIKQVVMTNDPFDPIERNFWEQNPNEDARFKASLRIDPLLVDYSFARKELRGLGYDVGASLDRQTISEIQRFLLDWIKKVDASYLAASLPPDFAIAQTWMGQVVEKCILPVCSESNLPLALMIGVKRLANKELGIAGDSVGKMEISVLEYLCSQYPDNKFLVTLLSRENQHELAITARKYRNLMVFGCWWFLNSPSLIEEITKLRFETLGFSFIPQHSDARVLEHLLYKWRHSKEVIASVLLEHYTSLLENGWQLTKADLVGDLAALFADNFECFIGGTLIS